MSTHAECEDRKCPECWEEGYEKGYANGFDALSSIHEKYSTEVVCPCCRGIEQGGCQECKGTGLVSVAYDTLRLHWKLALERIQEEADNPELQYRGEAPRVVYQAGIRFAIDVLKGKEPKRGKD